MNSTASRIHPGIILRTEFFESLAITQLAAAKATGKFRANLSHDFVLLP